MRSDAIDIISHETGVDSDTILEVLSMGPTILRKFAEAKRDLNGWIAINFQCGGSTEMRLCPLVGGGVILYTEGSRKSRKRVSENQGKKVNSAGRR